MKKKDFGCFISICYFVFLISYPLITIIITLFFLIILYLLYKKDYNHINKIEKEEQVKEKIALKKAEKNLEEKKYQQEKDDSLKEYFILREREANYLIDEILSNSYSNNKNIRKFQEIQPIEKVEGSRAKQKILKKINEIYLPLLYVDENYLYISEATFKTKFPKFFIKFDNGYKRFGRISFYGYNNARIEDCFLYSRFQGNFFINKTEILYMLAYNRSENKFTTITNNIILNKEDIDDIFIISLHNFVKKSDMYAYITATKAKIRKNTQVIFEYTIKNNNCINTDTNEPYTIILKRKKGDELFDFRKYV